jgi:hypothetical protein
METHDPDLWEHDGYHACLFDTPDGWGMFNEPSVSQGSQPELSVTYSQDVGKYIRTITISSSVAAGDVELTLSYLKPASSEYREFSHLYTVPNPASLTDRATIEDAHDQAVTIAERLNDVGIPGVLPDVLDAATNDRIRGSGPYGSVTPSRLA